MRKGSGLRSALVDFIFFSFFLFCLFILLFTIMVCCDGNSLVKIRRNGKQRMKESDHQGTDKGGCFAFALYRFPGAASTGRRNWKCMIALDAFVMPCFAHEL